MPSLSVVNMEGKKVGTINLADSVFGIEPNAAVMHQMVVNYLAAQRQGTQSALTRSEVSGGGKKPWRQKGTGRARQGSTRAPQWTHGGVVFAPKPRDYRFSVNKKVRRLAMKSAFSSSGRSSSLTSKFENPTIAFSGVRISWLILARKDCFSSASIARSFALMSSSSLSLKCCTLVIKPIMEAVSAIASVGLT